MKKIVSAIALCAAASTFAADAVYSANIVGFQTVETPAADGYKLMSVQLPAGELNTVHISGLLDVTTLNAATENGSYTEADQIVTFDGNEYTTYALHWTGKWMETGNTANWYATQQEADVTFAAGDSYWFKAAPSATLGSTTISGNVVVDPTVTISVKEGLNMISYPFSANINLIDLQGLTGATAAAVNSSWNDCDQIMVFDNGSYTTFALHWSGKWMETGNTANWYATHEASNVEIPMGSGFWYKAAGDADLEFVRPYNVN